MILTHLNKIMVLKRLLEPQGTLATHGLLQIGVQRVAFNPVQVCGVGNCESPSSDTAACLHAVFTGSLAEDE